MMNQASFQIPPKTIVVLRALQLGDLLCAVPAFRALRAAFPTAHIGLVGLRWAGTFVSRFSKYLDEFIEFPGYPGLPERAGTISAIPPFLTAMQQRRFDLALQMHGSGLYTNQLIALFDAKMTAGFVQEGGYCPEQRMFVPYPNHVPEPDRHLALLHHLGIPADDNHLEFPLFADDVTAFRALQSAHELQRGSYVCVHPGGRGQERRWDPRLFSLVADQLAQSGYRVVVTGTEEERPIAGSVMAHMHEHAIDLVGRTELGTLGALLSESAMLIANDTGVSHLAAALDVPSVIISIGSDPVRWSPHNHRLHRVLIGHATTVSDVMSIIHAVERSVSYHHRNTPTKRDRKSTRPDPSRTQLLVDERVSVTHRGTV